MSLDPEKAENIPRKLIGMYSDTELSLLGMMADAVVKGIDDDDWYTRQSAEALRYRTAAQRLANGLTQAAPTVVSEAVQDAVKFGADAVDADIDLAGHLAAKSGEAAGLQATISIGDKTSKLTRKAVADCVGTLATVNQALPGAASKLYQQVTARVNATPVSSDLTRRQAVQQALDVLTARGITGFRDNAGRNWSLSTYVEMKSRTLVNNTLMQSHIDRMLDRGLDLVVVSSHRNPAPQCQPFEGQVLSIGEAPAGTSIRPNATGGQPVRVKIKATMDEARARGFRHPNCRHSVAAFIPGASRTFTTEPDVEGYKATQQLRAMERAIRETKRRQAVAIDPAVKKRLGATLRSQQSTLKQHVDANDLKRRALRERPDLGYRINPPDALDSVKVPTPAPPAPKPTAPRPTTDAAKVPVEYGPGLSQLDRASIQRFIDAVPAAAQASLRASGTRMVIARDFTATSIGDRLVGKFTADGRPLSESSFYRPSENLIVMQARTTGGTVNTVAHEMGHALDINHLATRPRTVTWDTPGAAAQVHTVTQFAQDPFLQYAHSLVRASSTGEKYYKLGSAGNSESGRREWIAEAYAAIVENREDRLLDISGGSREAADLIRWTFSRYGVLE